MSIEELRAEKITEGLVFGEGIRWARDAIVLSDMIGRRVVQVDPASGEIQTLLEVENQPNGLVCMDDGAILVLSMFDRKILRLQDGDVEVYADLAEVTTGYLGDVVMSSDGSLYVDDIGSRVFHGEPPGKSGRLVRVAPDGEISLPLENLSFPNGVTISADGRRLYLVETMAKLETLSSAINVYEIDPDGQLAEGKRLPELPGKLFDGMSMDDEDGLWPCAPNAHEVLRLDRNGDITHRIAMPGFDPISCTIGGPDGRTMYITGIEDIGDKNMFEEMKAARVRTSIWKVSVPFGAERARP